MIWFASPVPVVDAARLDDADDMAEIHALSFHRGWPAAEIEALVADPGVLALVARRAGTFAGRQVVAFLLLRVAADEAEVLTIAVHPRHRAKGVGRRLMEEAMRRLYFDRVASLFLEVDEGNVAATRLYARLGFRNVGARANYYRGEAGTTSNALVMRADLT